MSYGDKNEVAALVPRYANTSGVFDQLTRPTQAQVTAWLAKQGYKNVFNVRGGIDAYASQVDQSVGFY